MFFFIVPLFVGKHVVLQFCLLLFSFSHFMFLVIISYMANCRFLLIRMWFPIFVGVGVSMFLPREVYVDNLTPNSDTLTVQFSIHQHRNSNVSWHESRQCLSVNLNFYVFNCLDARLRPAKGISANQENQLCALEVSSWIHNELTQYQLFLTQIFV